MWLVTIIYGDLLLLLGIGFYFGTGRTSMTALIPAAFGLVASACGALAKNEKLRKHAMHAASMVGLIGFLATLGGITDVMKMASGADVTRPMAAIEKSVMAALSAIFFALCVKSFVDARLRRKAESADPSSL